MVSSMNLNLKWPDIAYFSVFALLIVSNYFMCHDCASYHIIDKNGHELSQEEINNILRDYVNKNNDHDQTTDFNITSTSIHNQTGNITQ